MIEMYWLESEGVVEGERVVQGATYAHVRHSGEEPLSVSLFSDCETQDSVLNDLYAISAHQVQGSGYRLVRLSKLHRRIHLDERGMGELQMLPTRLTPICTFDEQGRPVPIAPRTVAR